MTRNGYDEAGDDVGAIFAAAGLVGSAITVLGLVLGLASFRFGEGSERTLTWFFPVASLFADWVLHSAFLPMMFLQWVSYSLCGALAVRRRRWWWIALPVFVHLSALWIALRHAH